MSELVKGGNMKDSCIRTIALPDAIKLLLSNTLDEYASLSLYKSLLDMAITEEDAVDIHTSNTYYEKHVPENTEHLWKKLKSHFKYGSPEGGEVEFRGEPEENDYLRVLSRLSLKVVSSTRKDHWCRGCGDVIKSGSKSVTTITVETTKGKKRKFSAVRFCDKCEGDWLKIVALPMINEEYRKMIDGEFLDSKELKRLVSNKRRLKKWGTAYGSGPCPKCDGETKLIKGGRSSKFYSCIKYPYCQGTRYHSQEDYERTVAVAGDIRR